MARPIDELVRHDRVARRILLFQASDRRRRQQSVTTEHLESADVRPIVDLARRVAMPPRMPREEDDGDAAEPARKIRVGGGPERSLQLLLFQVLDSRQVVDPAPPDQSHPASFLHAPVPFPEAAETASACWAMAS